LFVKLRHAPLIATLLAIATPVAAAPMPGAMAPVSIVARDQPVGDFVRDLFGRVGQPVVVSSNLTGTINGSFSGPVAKVFGDIAKAFNLVGYFDGAAVYVYSANELTVQTIPANRTTAARVIRQVEAQRISDTRNLLRASSDGTLVASGTPRFIEQVNSLVHGPALAANGFGAPRLPYETNDQPLEFRVFYLRYARADDTTMESGGREIHVPGIATIVQNLVLDKRPNMSGYGSFPVRQSAVRLKGQGLDSVRPNVSQMPMLGLPMGGVYPTAPGAGPQLAVATDDGGSAPLTSDIVRVQANPFTNSVIVRDVPERMAAYDSLIRALDVEPQMVELEATIIDLDTNKLRALGLNWRLNTGGFGALFGDGTDNDLGLLRTPGSRRDNVDKITPKALGGTISAIIGNHRQFISRLSALEDKGIARIVSRPQVMTMSDIEAVFDRTQTFYVRVAGREEVDLFNVTAGIVLRVNPHVFRDHDQTRIRMVINVEDGQLTPNATVDNIPIIERASVSTQAMVLDGQSLLLGGMTADQDRDDTSKIPLLGDIPLLGHLFKTQQKVRAHTERLFLLTPRLATLSGSAAPVSVSQTTQAAQPYLAQPAGKLR